MAHTIGMIILNPPVDQQIQLVQHNNVLELLRRVIGVEIEPLTVTAGAIYIKKILLYIL